MVDPATGSTPLVVASENGHLEVVDFLLKELSADVEQVNHHCHSII